MSRYIDAEPLEHRSPKLRTLILEQPTVDVEPVRHGQWIKAVLIYEPDYSVWSYSDASAECDQCHKVTFNGWGMNYCPNCGAKMDKEEQENETDRP